MEGVVDLRVGVGRGELVLLLECRQARERNCISGGGGLLRLSPCVLGRPEALDGRIEHPPEAMESRPRWRCKTARRGGTPAPCAFPTPEGGRGSFRPRRRCGPA